MAKHYLDIEHKFTYTKDYYGQYHSFNDKPAIEYIETGTKIWMKNGELHRDIKNGPAIVSKTQNKYYVDGKLHDMEEQRGHTTENTQTHSETDHSKPKEPKRKNMNKEYFHCYECKKETKAENIKQTPPMNDHCMMKGNCSVCGIKVSKLC